MRYEWQCACDVKWVIPRGHKENKLPRESTYGWLPTSKKFRNASHVTMHMMFTHYITTSWCPFLVCWSCKTLFQLYIFSSEITKSPNPAGVDSTGDGTLHFQADWAQNQSDVDLALRNKSTTSKKHTLVDTWFRALDQKIKVSLTFSDCCLN